MPQNFSHWLLVELPGFLASNNIFYSIEVDGQSPPPEKFRHFTGSIIISYVKNLVHNPYPLIGLSMTIV